VSIQRQSARASRCHHRSHRPPHRANDKVSFHLSCPYGHDNTISGALERNVRALCDTRTVATNRTNRPFPEEVKRLLAQCQMSISELAEQVGVSQPYLSRVLREVDYKTASARLARSVAEAFGLPRDYFYEFREDFVITKIRRSPKLRDELYDAFTVRRRKSNLNPRK
jgi:transcriptional regulator with XRE-family HTH domain